MAARFTTIKVETLGRVARLTLNRPERANALDQTMLGEIGVALDELQQDADVRALIVTGAGAAFSSGFDLKEQMERRPTGAAAWELALACDMTIASEDAFFGEPELKFGAGIVAMILPWLVGPKIAKEIILLGEDRIPAARARELGIVNRVVPGAELEATALAIANHLAAIDPNLVKETKRAINRAYEARNMLDALEEALAIDLAIEGAGSPDKIAFMDTARRQGLKAALAWRDARFPGRVR